MNSMEKLTRNESKYYLKKKKVEKLIAIITQTHICFTLVALTILI